LSDLKQGPQLDLVFGCVYADRRFAEMCSVDPATAEGGVPFPSICKACTPDDASWVGEAIQLAIEFGRRNADIGSAAIHLGSFSRLQRVRRECLQWVLAVWKLAAKANNLARKRWLGGFGCSQPFFGRSALIAL
jgi:hypothetical protein